MDIALLLIRAAVGGILAAHGTQKLFGWFGGHGLRGTAGFLESLGFRPGRAYAWLLGGTEVIAGVALAVGFLTPLAGAAAAGTMLAAVVVVHWNKGFWNTDGGFEFPSLMAIGAIAPAFGGAGRWSLDHALGWALDGTAWGVEAAAIAVASTALVAAARRIQIRPSRPGTAPA